MKQGYLQLDADASIYYQMSRQAETNIMLIPGWTMSVEVFNRQFEYFEGIPNVGVAAFDPRAHGKSNHTETGHNYAQQAHDMAALIKSLELENLVLVGWSFGVLAMLSYLELYGCNDLKGIVVLDGSPRVKGKGDKLEWVTYELDDINDEENFFSYGVLSDRKKFNDEFARWMLEDCSQQNLIWVHEISSQTPASVASELNLSAHDLDFSSILITLDSQLPMLYVVREEIFENVS